MRTNRIMRRRGARRGFIIIWGSTGVFGEDPHPPIRAGCPRCRNLVDLRSRTVQRYFTLFFIPLFPVGEKTRITECSFCRGQFAMPIEVMMSRLSGTPMAGPAGAIPGHLAAVPGQMGAMPGLPAPAFFPPPPSKGSGRIPWYVWLILAVGAVTIVFGTYTVLSRDASRRRAELAAEDRETALRPIREAAKAAQAAQLKEAAEAQAKKDWQQRQDAEGRLEAHRNREIAENAPTANNLLKWLHGDDPARRAKAFTELKHPATIQSLSAFDGESRAVHDIVCKLAQTHGHPSQVDAAAAVADIGSQRDSSFLRQLAADPKSGQSVSVHACVSAFFCDVPTGLTIAEAHGSDAAWLSAMSVQLRGPRKGIGEPAAIAMLRSNQLTLRQTAVQILNEVGQTEDGTRALQKAAANDTDAGIKQSAQAAIPGVLRRRKESGRG